MTRQELYEKVLQKLGVASAIDPSQPEDIALVASYYEGLYGLLNSEGLVSWAVGSDIPDNVSVTIIPMVACAVAKEFGYEGQRYAELLAEGGFDIVPMSMNERRLRRIQARKYVSTRLRTEYF